jgi:16S rRNA G966 N2-methylase RsmD
MPAARAITQLGRRGRRFDLVFLDPPYPLNAWDAALDGLRDAGLLLPSAVVVCEHPTHGSFSAAHDGYVHEDRRTFGDVALSFFVPAKGT